MTRNAIAREIVALGASFFDRGLTHGRTGNISARLAEEILITPTGHGLGSLSVSDLVSIDLAGQAVDQGRPSKEAFLHAAIYRARPSANAVIHLHSTHAVALSCLEHIDSESILPPLTAYFELKVGPLTLLPYFAPGDRAASGAVEEHARDSASILLANHGPIVARTGLADAADAIEELEESARIYLLTMTLPTRPLTPLQVSALTAGVTT